MTNNLAYRDELLADLAHKLKKFEDANARTPRRSATFAKTRVIFYSKPNGKGRVLMTWLGFTEALHAIVEDIFTDGECDWHEARSVEIDTY